MKNLEKSFNTLYSKLNKAQKEAVSIIDGPVMVIAGPGTGKTQVLVMRIANILKNTDTPADGILCLTFTNSGVKAMRERLVNLVGSRANEVQIATFHSFASAIIEEFYELLNLNSPPSLLDDNEAVILFDKILEEGEWTKIKFNSGGSNNYKDLRTLISNLKRENISPELFEREIILEIDKIKKNPDNISSRGPSKGSLKSEALSKISSMERTIEVARFYGEYERAKKDANLTDYDDALTMALHLIKNFDEVRATIAERYLYVLVDEHQDTNGVQNQFLQLVWKDVEKPNIFVVGDDRQLIYGFGGASVTHFESFIENFKDTKLITLIENYRSTQKILDVADILLKSKLTNGKLKSQSKEIHPLALVEAPFQRDEVIMAGIDIKRKIKNGLKPEDCAILVPKNYQIRSAVTILKDLGLPAASEGKASLFALREAETLFLGLKIINDPFDRASLSKFILEPSLNLPILLAEKILKEHRNKLSLEVLSEEKNRLGEICKKLISLVSFSKEYGVYETIQALAKFLFFDDVKDHQKLIRQVEVVRTIIHLSLSRIEKKDKLTLADFVSFLGRLQEYGENIPLTVFTGSEGVRVMTLHSSKGLEFEYVWVLHVDEKSLMKGKNPSFSLPDKFIEFNSKKDEETARRELYVAITRAKRFCTLSYAKKSYTGGDLVLARIVREMPEEIFERQSMEETESKIIEENPLHFVSQTEVPDKNSEIEEIKKWVSNEYASGSISATNLNNFFSCPWKWYFRNFINLPEPENEHLLFGNFIHELIEKSILDRRIAEDYDKSLDNQKIFNEKLRKKFSKNADEVLQKFNKKIMPYLADDLKTEYALRVVDKETGILVNGKIDLIENIDGEYRVSDFKSGKYKKIEDYERQLAMYSYLLNFQKKSIKASNSRLIFLSEDEKKYINEVSVGDEEVKKLKEEIREFSDSLKSGNWVNRVCESKSRQGEESCPYCKLAKIYQ